MQKREDRLNGQVPATAGAVAVDLAARAARNAAEQARREAARAEAERQAAAEHRRRYEQDPEYRAACNTQDAAAARKALLTAGVPVGLLQGQAAARWDWSGWHRADRRELLTYAEGGWRNSQGLVLMGAVGVGKTRGLALVADALARARERLAWVNGGHLLRAAHAGEVTAESLPGRRWFLVPNLLLDELSADDVLQPWQRRDLLLLLNERLEAGRRTLVTTNSDLPALRTAFGERFVSRLLDISRVTVVAWRGTRDHRTGLDNLRPEA